VSYNSSVIFLFLIFSAILVYFSFKSFLGGVAYLAYFRDQLAKPTSDFTPFATIIAPCKGLDDGLRENLSALLDLEYPEYEVIFVVEDEDDPALSVIDELKQAHPRHPVKTAISSRSTESGQKVENIREAVKHADSRTEAFVFVDSDARPQSQWLRHIVAPLSQKNVGAATGYRGFLLK